MELFYLCFFCFFENFIVEKEGLELIYFHTMQGVDMRKIARISGLVIVTIVAAFYLFIISVSIIDGEPMETDWESLGMTMLSFLTVVSAVLSWVKTPIGAWTTLGVGVLFSIFAMVTAGHNHLFAVLVSGAPLILAAILMKVGLRKLS